MLHYGFLCLITLYSLLNAQTEIPAQVVTLLDKKSYVEYKFIEWNYKGLYYYYISIRQNIDSIFMSLINFN